MKDKFEIGRLLAGSVGSSPGFFTRGRMMARLCFSGRDAGTMDTLMRRARIGAKTMHMDLSSETGAESNSHCFVDESLKSLSTSAVVTSSNLHNEWTGGNRVEKSGTGASFVDSRIALTLFSK